MLVRKITSQDFESVYKINLEVIHNPWTKEAIENEIKDWSEFSKVLETSPFNVIGYILVRRLAEHCEITSLAILKDHQGKGLGEYLLRIIIGEAKNSKNIKGLLLEVNQNNNAAIRLYTKVGFKQTRVRERYYRDGSNAIEMSLEV